MYGILEILKDYWPGLLIIAGIGYLIYGNRDGETALGVITFIIFSGLGILFFIWPPGEIWAWMSKVEVIHFLFSGHWYEVMLKVVGTFSTIGFMVKLLYLGGLDGAKNTMEQPGNRETAGFYFHALGDYHSWIFV